MNINNQFTKRAQIGVTLTWMTAFLIIFFIMLLFLASTIILAGKQKLTFSKDQISIGSFESGDYALQKGLTGFLVSNVDNKKVIDYLGINFDEKLLEGKAKDYFGLGDCYLFCIYDKDKNISFMQNCPNISGDLTVKAICEQVYTENHQFSGFNYAQYDNINGQLKIGLLKEIKNE